MCNYYVVHLKIIILYVNYIWKIKNILKNMAYKAQMQKWQINNSLYTKQSFALKTRMLCKCKQSKLTSRNLPDPWFWRLWNPSEFRLLLKENIFTILFWWLDIEYFFTRSLVIIKIKINSRDLWITIHTPYCAG